MRWIDLLCAMYEQETGNADEAALKRIHAEERLTLDRTPKIEISRRSKRPKSFGVMRGTASYDPGGTILLSQTGKNTDIIYEEDTFITQVHCLLPLPTPGDTLIQVKGSGWSGAWRKNRPLSDKREWVVKSLLPVSKVHEILRAAGELEQECARYMTIRVFPGQPCRLAVETVLFSDLLDNFCLVADFYPTAEDGRRLSSREAAVFLLNNMVKCCCAVYSILT